MCRLLGYLGKSIQLDQILYKPEHSLIVQSYQPQEMTVGLLNADGFGVGWFHPQKSEHPYIYKNILPIWSDLNLKEISRYAESNCILAYVRSATVGLAVDLSNCQPFKCDHILFIHNGYIQNFRQTLYRPIRNSLDDRIYQLIKGTTDSEHIFAMILNEIQINPEISLDNAVTNALSKLTALAQKYQVYFSANMIISTGTNLIATRYAHGKPAPSLYWLRDDLLYPESVVIASEPLFAGGWNSFPEHSLISVEQNLDFKLHKL